MAVFKEVKAYFRAKVDFCVRDYKTDCSTDSVGFVVIVVRKQGVCCGIEVENKVVCADCGTEVEVCLVVKGTFENCCNAETLHRGNLESQVYGRVIGVKAVWNCCTNLDCQVAFFVVVAYAKGTFCVFVCIRNKPYNIG